MTTVEVLTGLVALSPVIGMSALAFWKPHVITFMLTAGLSNMIAFYLFDLFGGFYWLTVTLIMLGYSLTMLGFGLWQMFATRSEG